MVYEQLIYKTNKIFYFIVLIAVASPVTAAEYFKYIDQNGLEYWVNDNSKIPPPIPIKFKYEDKYGMTFWVDDAGKIPAEYRNKPDKREETTDTSRSDINPQPVGKKQYSTKISIVDNVIIVPVVLRNKGRKVKAKMILDTGASVTTIYSGLASRLNLHKNMLSRALSVNANGITSESIRTKVDYIEVDDKILANAEIAVIPSHTNIGADGLLGNSFLRFFNFSIDYNKQLLQWN